MGNPNSSQIQPVQAAGMVDLSKNVAAHAGQYLDTGFGNVPQQQTLGFNQYQSSTMDALQALYSQANPLTASSTNYAADVLGGKYLNPASNPSLQGSADALMGQSQRFLNQNLDNVDSTFGLYGGGGGSAQANAKARQVVDANTGLSSALAALYGNAYSNERGMQQGMVPMAQNLAQDPLSRALGALQLGGQQQSLQQMIANMPYQNFINAMNAQGSSLSGAAGALGGIGSTYMMPSYQPSELSQNLGAVFGGLGAVGTLAKGVGSLIHK